MLKELTQQPSTMPRIVIFANGLLPHPEQLLRRLRPDDRIFCADGGAAHALALGLTPEIVIGDLDSLPAEVVIRLAEQGVRIERYSVRKDQTDLDLAVERAAAEHPSEIMLVAVLGGRLDQMLANLLLLTRPAYATYKISLTDGPQWAAVLHAGQTLAIAGQPGDTLSLIPLSPSVSQVTLSGVEWPLQAALLTLGSTRTISNILVETKAVLSIGQGLLLVVHLEQAKTDKL